MCLWPFISLSPRHDGGSPVLNGPYLFPANNKNRRQLLWPHRKRILGGRNFRLWLFGLFGSSLAKKSGWNCYLWSGLLLGTTYYIAWQWLFKSMKVEFCVGLPVVGLGAFGLAADWRWAQTNGRRHFSGTENRCSISIDFPRSLFFGALVEGFWYRNSYTTIHYY